MDILYERVAGLDVHKDTVVACVRIMADGKATRECRTFATATEQLVELRAWLKKAGARTWRWRRPASIGCRCSKSLAKGSSN